MIDHKKNAHTLLSVLQTYAPTGKEQQECTELHNSISNEREREYTMLYALTDGINYGNWPWIDFNPHLKERKVS